MPDFLSDSWEVPNTNWTSSNEFQIPDLLPELQAPFVEEPVRPWGGHSEHWRANKHTKFRGTWCFYTDDKFFNPIRKHRFRPLVTGAPALCEINFSTSDRMMMWEVLELIGTKRWISRYWQEDGRHILVDLNVTPKWEELNLVGVPDGWRAFCTRGSDRDMEGLERQHKIAVEKAQGQRVIMLVYGGGSKVRSFCMEHGLTYCESEMQMMRKK